MPTFRRSIAISAPHDAVYSWHMRPGALERLLPPWSGITVERAPTKGIADGSKVTLRLRVGPLRLPWVAVHYGTSPGRQFCDQQLEGPFHSWHHVHRMTPDPAQNGAGCLLEDEIRYALPWGLRSIGPIRKRVERALERTFAFRHARIRADVVRHQRFADRGPLRIAVTGSNGLLGRRVVPFLRSGGHTVIRLVRGGRNLPPDAVFWDPQSGALDVERLGTVDAVIHLAGVNIADGRWTDARKAEIRESRVLVTRELCASLAALAKPPQVFVSASAVGYYGNRTEGPVAEEDGPGRGFLAEICQAWEGAASPLQKSGTRMVHLRLGVVLAQEGGALKRMLPAFRWGVAGRLGSGRQFMPWIAAEDATGVIHQALFDGTLSGPVNAVSPQAATNGQFTQVLANVLNRLAIIPVPGIALRLLFGQMGTELLLEGAQVVPRKLVNAGFPFLLPDLKSALRSELGR